MDRIYKLEQHLRGIDPLTYDQGKYDDEGAGDLAYHFAIAHGKGAKTSDPGVHAKTAGELGAAAGLNPVDTHRLNAIEWPIGRFGSQEKPTLADAIKVLESLQRSQNLETAFEVARVERYRKERNR